MMYKYWVQQTSRREQPTPRQVSKSCGTTIHAARDAVRRFRSGIVPKPLPPRLSPKNVRNVRQAILLLGGDNAGDWKAWYDRNIPIAEQRYEDWLDMGGE